VGPEDAAGLYAEWEDKGPVSGGERLTLLAARTRVGAGEPVEVLHVYEITDSGRQLHVMGPKPLFGERLDGELATPPPPDDDDSLHPGLYDGRVLPSPGMDVNFEPTTYTFSEPGRHELTWSVNGLTSNTLAIDVG
jgi:hypothetical protein